MEYPQHEKFTHRDLQDHHVLERFKHLQKEAGLQTHGQERVNNALEAAVVHITKKYGLSGMHSNHVDEGLRYLFSDQYKGHSEFEPKEKKVIEQSLHAHFHGTPALPEMDKTD